MEEKEVKKHKKMEQGTVIAIILALMLGIGIGYIAGRGEEKPSITIEKCSNTDLTK